MLTILPCAGGENWIHEKPELNTEIRVVITQGRRVSVEAVLTMNKGTESAETWNNRP